MASEILKKIKELKKNGQITQQEFRTYKGQILNGNEEAAVRGLRRKGMIT